ncbi:MAG: hypothetical protein U1E62_10310 [Alsobacter sp.]
MGSGKNRATAPELALLVAAADRGGALVLPSMLRDPVILTLELEGHLVRIQDEADERCALTRIQLTRSGWTLARRERVTSAAAPAAREISYRRPDVIPDALSWAWRS